MTIGYNNQDDNEVKRLTKQYIADLDKEIKFLRGNSNIPHNYWQFKWDSYYVDRLNVKDKKKFKQEVINSRKNAKLICGKTAMSWNIICEKQMGSSFVLLGQSGSGKSVLGTLMLRDAINRVREPVLYVNYSNLALEMLRIYLQKDYDEFEEKYMAPTILMIDEIESGYTIGKNGMPMNQKIQEYLTLLLTSRYLNKKPTIITTSIMDHNLLEDTIGETAFKVIKKEQYMWVPILGSRDVEEVPVIIPEGHYDLKKMIDELTKEYAKRKADHQEKVNKSKDNIKEAAELKKSSAFVGFTNQVVLSNIIKGAMKG